MKHPIVLLLIAFVVLFPLSYARSQDGNAEVKKARDEFQTLLKQTNQNNDEKISREEFLAKFKDNKIGEKKFEDLDVNKDGYISEDEYVKVTLKNEIKKMNEEEEKSD